MSASALPNFLCIGAQKAATTWLHWTLSTHPEIWMPPVKELHHFDATQKLPLFLYLHQGRRSHEGRLAIRGKDAWSVNSSWVARYLLLYRNDRWYQSLFMPKHGQICGEITPGYARMPTELVAHVNSILPRTKIIYMLRDPVERSWSQFKMRLENWYKIQADTLTDEEIHQRIMRDLASYEENNHFVEKLVRWESYFPANQILVTFYDELVTNAPELIKKIWGYLDVTVDDKFIPENVTKAVGQRPSQPMPLPTRRWLTEQIYPQYEELHQRFNNQYTDRWLANAKATLS